MDILLCETFQHERAGDNVDEVRFDCAVYVQAFRIVGRQQNPHPSLVQFKGATGPSSFAIEVFAHNLRRAGDRFEKAFGPHEYVEDGTCILDLGGRLTDHIIFRGGYCILSIVIYGARAEKDTLKTELGSSCRGPIETLSRVAALGGIPPESLPKPFREEKDCLLDVKGPLLSLSFKRCLEGRGEIVMEERFYEEGRSALRRAAQDWRASGATCSDMQVHALKLAAIARGGGMRAVQAQSNVTESRKVGIRESGYMGPNTQAADEQEAQENDEVAMVLMWLHEVLRVDANLPQLEVVLGTMAATEVICRDARRCFLFARAGGMSLLATALRRPWGGASHVRERALLAVETASAHACANHALLGWWPGKEGGGEGGEGGASAGYGALLALLLQSASQKKVSFGAARLLRRLRAFEVSARLQAASESLLADPFKMPEKGPQIVKKIAELMTQFESLLSAPRMAEEDWPPALSAAQWLCSDPLAENGDDEGEKILPVKASYCASGGASAVQDLDLTVLAMLMEQRIVALLAALLVLPWLRSRAEVNRLLYSLQSLMLLLLSDPVGLLLFTEDIEATKLMIAALGGSPHTPKRESGEREPYNQPLSLKRAAAFDSVGLLCHPQQLATLLKHAMMAVSGADALLSSDPASEERLLSFWQLALLAREDVSRWAVVTVAQIPSVIDRVVQAAGSGPARGTASKWVYAHHAAQILEALLADTWPASLARWAPHAAAVQLAVGESLAAPSGAGLRATGPESSLARVRTLAEPMAVYQREGLGGLLRLAEGLAESLEKPSSEDAADGNGGFAGGERLGGNSGVGYSPYANAAAVQLTVALRTMAALCWHVAVPGALYANGAMGVIQQVVKHSATALHLITLSVREGGVEKELAEKQTERQVSDLLVPALLLLLTLLRRLQAASGTYRNTKLLEGLLELQKALSHRATFYTEVDLNSSERSVGILAVRQVLATVLACWPVDGLHPPLLPRLLGLPSVTPDQMQLPLLSPAEACGALSLLSDMLPDECPPPARIGPQGLLRDCSPAVAAVEVVGSISATALARPQPSSVQMERLTRVLLLHTTPLTRLLVRAAAGGCERQRRSAERLMARAASGSGEVGAALVGGLLEGLQGLIEEEMPVSILNPSRNQRDKEMQGVGVVSVGEGAVETQDAGMEGEVSAKGESRIVDGRVGCVVRLIADLAQHPVPKALLLQERVPALLVQFLNLPKAAEGPLNAEKRQWAIVAIRNLCSSKSSFMQDVANRSEDQSGSEKLPEFSDCCVVASALLAFLAEVEIGEQTVFALQALGGLVEHKAGQAALVHTAATPHGRADDEEELQESRAADHVKREEIELGMEESKEHKEEPLVSKVEQGFQNMDHKVETKVPSASLQALWARLTACLQVGETNSMLVRCAELAIHVALELTKSFCGLEALCRLTAWPLDTTAQTGHVLLQMVDALQKLSLQSETWIPASQASQALLNILKTATPSSTKELVEKVQEFVDSLTPPRPVEDRLRAMAALRPRPGRQPLPAAITSSLTGRRGLHSNDADLVTQSLSPLAEWECATAPLHPIVREDARAEGALKRSGSSLENDSKRVRTEAEPNPGGAGGKALPEAPLAARQGAGVTFGGSAAGGSTRRDSFRLRKPNSSRPASMHVDDYVARERGGDASQMSGRPPSIHVDEFMARQRQSGGPAPVVVGALPPSLRGENSGQPLASPQPPSAHLVRSSSTASGEAAPSLLHGAAGNGNMGTGDGRRPPQDVKGSEVDAPPSGREATAETLHPPGVEPSPTSSRTSPAGNEQAHPQGKDVAPSEPLNEQFPSGMFSSSPRLAQPSGKQGMSPAGPWQGQPFVPHSLQQQQQQHFGAQTEAEAQSQGQQSQGKQLQPTYEMQQHQPHQSPQQQPLSQQQSPLPPPPPQQHQQQFLAPSMPSIHQMQSPQQLQQQSGGPPGPNWVSSPLSRPTGPEQPAWQPRPEGGMPPTSSSWPSPAQLSQGALPFPPPAPPPSHPRPGGWLPDPILGSPPPLVPQTLPPPPPPKIPGQSAPNTRPPNGSPAPWQMQGQARLPVEGGSDPSFSEISPSWPAGMALPLPGGVGAGQPRAAGPPFAMQGGQAYGLPRPGGGGILPMGLAHMGASPYPPARPPPLPAGAPPLPPGLPPASRPPSLQQQMQPQFPQTQMPPQMNSQHMQAQQMLPQQMGLQQQVASQQVAPKQMPPQQVPPQRQAQQIPPSQATGQQMSSPQVPPQMPPQQPLSQPMPHPQMHPQALSQQMPPQMLSQPGLPQQSPPQAMVPSQMRPPQVAPPFQQQQQQQLRPPSSSPQLMGSALQGPPQRPPLATLGVAPQQFAGQQTMQSAPPQAMHGPAGGPPVTPPLAQPQPQNIAGIQLLFGTSPEAIEKLLRDPSKLQELLEQNPKLITLLQARLGGT